MKFNSKLVADAVQEFSKLPGIGEKTALRLVLHLLKQDKEKVTHFSNTISKMREEIKFCKNCHAIADNEICEICASPFREQSQICIVESIRELIAIESTGIYKGLYHVLGGLIAPVDGVGPEQLQIESLVNRVRTNAVNEIIMAVSPTIEGDTTIFYISKKLAADNIKITSIARGVSFGGEIEYTDELTLARSIVTRLPYENVLVKN